MPYFSLTNLSGVFWAGLGVLDLGEGPVSHQYHSGSPEVPISQVEVIELWAAPVWPRWARTQRRSIPTGAPTGLFVLLCLLTEEIGGGGGIDRAHTALLSPRLRRRVCAHMRFHSRTVARMRPHHCVSVYPSTGVKGFEPRCCWDTTAFIPEL